LSADAQFISCGKVRPKFNLQNTQKNRGNSMANIAMSVGRFVFTVYSWHVLKIIGGSFLSSLTVAIPLLGYLIFFGSYSNGVYQLDIKNLGSYEITFGEDFGFIRLKLTYVGLFIIGFTTIIFKVFCPAEVSNYRDDRGYVEHSIATSFPDEVQRYQDWVKQRFWYAFSLPVLDAARTAELINENTSKASKIHNGGQKTPLERSEWLEKNLNAMNSIYSAGYQIKDHSNFLTRSFVLAGYLVGFLLTLLPSFQVFGEVLVETIVYLRMEFL